jgi:hypothetical protein
MNAAGWWANANTREERHMDQEYHTSAWSNCPFCALGNLRSSPLK